MCPPRVVLLGGFTADLTDALVDEAEVLHQPVIDAAVHDWRRLHHVELDDDACTAQLVDLPDAREGAIEGDRAAYPSGIPAHALSQLGNTAAAGRHGVAVQRHEVQPTPLFEDFAAFGGDPFGETTAAIGEVGDDGVLTQLLQPLHDVGDGLGAPVAVEDQSTDGDDAPADDQTSTSGRCEPASWELLEQLTHPGDERDGVRMVAEHDHATSRRFTTVVDDVDLDVEHLLVDASHDLARPVEGVAVGVLTLDGLSDGAEQVPEGDVQAE